MSVTAEDKENNSLAVNPNTESLAQRVRTSQTSIRYDNRVLTKPPNPNSTKRKRKTLSVSDTHTPSTNTEQKGKVTE